MRGLIEGRAVRVFGFMMLACLNSGAGSPARAADSVEELADLRAISSFGTVVATLYSTDAGNRAATAELTSAALSDYLRSAVAKSIPDIPVRARQPGSQTAGEEDRSNAKLVCRIWMDNKTSPATFQVRCRVSTALRPDVLQDASLGYGPLEKAVPIVHDQLDRIVEGFAAVLAKARASN